MRLSAEQSTVVLKQRQIKHGSETDEGVSARTRIEKEYQETVKNHSRDS